MTISTTLFFKNNRIYGVGAITFDLILSEGHNLNNDITQYNVEDGSIISDHIRNQLESGVVSGLITNFSINDVALLGNKAQIAFDQIVQLWRDRTLVDIYTVYKVYEQVAITSISINRDESSGESLVADFSFQEMNIVSLQAVEVQAGIKLANMNSSQNRQSSVSSNFGKQTGV